jgi:beta-1,4-mannosyltransferase
MQLTHTTSGRLEGRDERLVLFSPDFSKGNPYQSLLAASLESLGFRVKFADLPGGLFQLFRLRLRHRELAVLHLHWANDLFPPICWASGSIKATAKAATLFLDCLLVRLLGSRVIWTVHNLISHESPCPGREVVARRMLARGATQVIFHSAPARMAAEELYGFSLEHKSSIMPHGNYDGCYVNKIGRAKMREQLGIKDNETVFLFFGAIRQYKGVQALIAAFQSLTPPCPARLIIAGNPNPDSLGGEIRRLTSASKEIICRLGYVPKNTVADLFSAADTVVLPFERTLTSGSTMLAMTMGKALILPEQGRVFDLIDEHGGIFYQNAFPNDIRSALEAAFTRDLKAMGQANRSKASLHTWSAAAAKLARAYCR